MRIYRRWIFSCLFLLVSSLASADIVFQSDRDGQFNIYVMRDDGSHVRRLTSTRLYDYAPTWSPDGKHIAFVRDMHWGGAGKGQQDDIFLMNADGTQLRNLTQHPEYDGGVTWAPDGKHLVFASGRSGETEIHVMELATGAVTQLTDNAKEGGFSAAPSWSPDGHHIAYEQVIPGGGRHIYLMDADGRNASPLLKGPQPHLIGEQLRSRGFPRWAPDGQHILYVEDDLRFEPGKIIRAANRLIVVDKNGRRPKNLAIPEKWDIGDACWTADGKAILFPAVKNGLTQPVRGKFDIYRYHLTSGQLTNLTNHPGDDYSPDWISRHRLSVSATGKLTLRWAQIKGRHAPGEPFSRLLVPAGASHR